MMQKIQKTSSEVLQFFSRIFEKNRQSYSYIYYVVINIPLDKFILIIF